MNLAQAEALAQAAFYGRGTALTVRETRGIAMLTTGNVECTGITHPGYARIALTVDTQLAAPSDEGDEVLVVNSVILATPANSDGDPWPEIIAYRVCVGATAGVADANSGVIPLDAPVIVPPGASFIFEPGDFRLRFPYT